ncbi:unnamed protein product, partial [Notodromas monacha]
MPFIAKDQTFVENTRWREREKRISGHQMSKILYFKTKKRSDFRPDDVLVREKRKAAGTAASDTQFVLTKLTGTDTPQIGDVLTY